MGKQKQPSARFVKVKLKGDKPVFYEFPSEKNAVGFMEDMMKDKGFRELLVEMEQGYFEKGTVEK